METYFTYLLKSCLWIALTWAAYRLFFRGQTFYRFNRRFLLAGLLTSLLLPAVQLRHRVEVPALPFDMSVVRGSGEVAVAARGLDWEWFLMIVYVVGILVFAVVVFRQVRRIYRLAKSGRVTRHDGYSVVDIGEPVSPFSFFNRIFIDPGNRTDAESAVILSHELSHVRQRHWVDLALGQLMLIAQWFNPFVWLLMREIRANHEFMADRAVLDEGNSQSFYKAVLVNNSLPVAAIPLGHPFSTRNTNTLNRYKMMNRKISAVSRKWLALAMIPAAALFLTAFARTEYVYAENPSAETPHAAETVPPGRVLTPEEEIIVNVPARAGEPLPLIIVDGRESTQSAIYALKPEDIESVSVLKDGYAVARYGESGRNGVILVVTKKGTGDIISTRRTLEGRLDSLRVVGYGTQRRAGASSEGRLDSLQVVGYGTQRKAGASSSETPSTIIILKK